MLGRAGMRFLSRFVIPNELFLGRTSKMLIELFANRMAPLVALQRKVYISILRKELPRLLAFSSGASNHQSLQNIVVLFLVFMEDFRTHFKERHPDISCAAVVVGKVGSDKWKSMSKVKKAPFVIQLRKACSHSYLFPGIEPEPFEEGEHLVQDFLELRKYSYERLDGSIRAEERFAAIRSFSQQSVTGSCKVEVDQSGAFVFMISTRAGGVGLNLVAADTVSIAIIY
ncbi:SNF2 domain-containing protein [Actinidia rufa]|uniref:SNF2 domain-containing protein n=1 Tax=Actinidia rufa TaxID=165716 RepID=A0A7J0F1W2_9ERIC|nr:SNF2 domain-containing protein [Actinidia rufa]